MKNYPEFILDLLSQPGASGFVAIEIDTEVPFRRTTLPYDVPINGNVYAKDLKLVNFDMPRADQAVGRESYRLTLSDPERQLESEISVGVGMRVDVGLLDEFGPRLDYLLRVYAGRIDTYTFKQAEGSRVLQIQGVSPAGALSYTRAIYTDVDYVKQQNPIDGSMDAIGSRTSEEITLSWGKRS